MIHDPPLTRKSRDQRPMLTLWEDACLPLGRAHELCGNARWTLALWIAARMKGPLIWISPRRNRDRMHSPGMARLFPPGEALFVQASTPSDLFWCMEESLRSGAAPTIVMELDTPPAITPVRRLHLAAEAGGGRSLGLLLTPGTGGAQAVETRWQLSSEYSDQGPGWRLRRLRARMFPPRDWFIARGQTAPDTHAPTAKAG